MGEADDDIGPGDAVELPDAFRSRFLEGRDLFNAGEYWESHEAWEDVWNAVEGRDRLLYQGLIQAAASMVHRQKSNDHGMHALYRRAMDKLRLFEHAPAGLDLKRFKADLEQAVSGGPWPVLHRRTGE